MHKCNTIAEDEHYDFAGKLFLSFRLLGTVQQGTVVD